MEIDNLDDFLPIMDDEITQHLLDDEPIIPQTTPEEDEEEEEDDDELAPEYDEPFIIGEEEGSEVQNLPLDEVRSAQATAEVLKQIGLILPESEINSYDDVEDLLKTQAPQSIANAMVEDLPDFGRDLAIFVLNKGSELTKEDIKEFYNDLFQDELIQSASFSEDNLDDAKTFLKKEFKAQGMRESVINKTLDALEVEDELLDEANALLEEKKKVSKTSAKAEQATQTANEKRQDEVAFIKTIRQEIVDTGWKKERQAKVLDVIANNKVSEIIKDALNDPKSFVAFANLLSYYDFKTKNFDLTDFLAKAATEEVEKTKKSIFRDAFNSKGSGGASEDAPKPGTRNKLAGLKPIL
jgi:hypothetical protein